MCSPNLPSHVTLVFFAFGWNEKENVTWEGKRFIGELDIFHEVDFPFGFSSTSASPWLFQNNTRRKGTAVETKIRKENVGWLRKGKSGPSTIPKASRFFPLPNILNRQPKESLSSALILFLSQPRLALWCKDFHEGDQPLLIQANHFHTAPLVRPKAKMKVGLD